MYSVLFAVDADFRQVDITITGVQLHGERCVTAVLFHSAVFHFRSDLRATQHFLLQFTHCTSTAHNQRPQILSEINESFVFFVFLLLFHSFFWFTYMVDKLVTSQQLGIS